jgi:hypothetical protein
MAEVFIEMVMRMVRHMMTLGRPDEPGVAASVPTEKRVHDLPLGLASFLPRRYDPPVPGSPGL